MLRNIIFSFFTSILLLFSLGQLGCNSTKHISPPLPNYDLEHEGGWTWIKPLSVEKEDKPYKLFFEAENRYTIYLDVNSCFGEYQKGEDQSLNLPDYSACTEMCCDKETAMDFVNAFHKTTNYAVHGDTLILSGGEKALRFLPAEGKESGE